LVPFFGAPNRNPSNKREMQKDLALGGCLYAATHNNQPRVNSHGRRVVGVEGQPGRSIVRISFMDISKFLT
jgi:hypothetical protein